MVSRLRTTGVLNFVCVVSLLAGILPFSAPQASSPPPMDINPRTLPAPEWMTPAGPAPSESFRPASLSDRSPESSAAPETGLPSGFLFLPIPSRPRVPIIWPEVPDPRPDGVGPGTGGRRPRPVSAGGAGSPISGCGGKRTAHSGHLARAGSARGVAGGSGPWAGTPFRARRGQDFCRGAGWESAFRASRRASTFVDVLAGRDGVGRSLAEGSGRPPPRASPTGRGPSGRGPRRGPSVGASGGRPRACGPLSPLPPPGGPEL